MAVSSQRLSMRIVLSNLMSRYDPEDINDQREWVINNG